MSRAGANAATIAGGQALNFRCRPIAWTTLNQLRASRDGSHSFLASNLRAYLDELELNPSRIFRLNVGGYAMAATILERQHETAKRLLITHYDSEWRNDLDLKESSP